MEGVETETARVLLWPDADRTVVALVRHTPLTRLSFRMTVAGGAEPPLQVLQVVDGANRLLDPATFSVRLLGEE